MHAQTPARDPQRYVTPIVLLALALALAALGSIVVRDLRSVANETRELNADLTRGLRLMQALQYETQETRRAVLYALSTADANEQVTFADQSRSAGDRASQLLAAAETIASAPLKGSALAPLTDEWNSYLQTRDEIIGLILEGSVREGVALDLGAGNEKFQRVQQQFNALSTGFEREASLLTDSVDRHSTLAIVRVSMIWLSALIAVGAALFVLSRRLAFERLRLSDAQRTAILEAVVDAVIEIESDGRISDCNPSAERLFRRDRRDIVGRSLAEIVVDSGQEHPIDGMAEALAGRCASAPGTIVEVECRYRDGSTFPVEMRVVRRASGGPARFAAHLRDITDRRQAEHDLRTAKDAAEAASTAKGDFLATMSHEVRTPLNVIMGVTSLLLDSPLTPDQRAWVLAGQTSGAALADLINGILDFSKIEANRLELDLQACRLGPLIDEIRRQATIAAHGKAIELTWEIDAAVPDVVLTDPIRLRQILMNLLSNAVKFTPRGKIATSVRATSRGPGVVELQFAVADTGIGISEKHQALLFRSFSQVDRSMTRRFGGSGLGLVISQRLAEILGGSIGVVSAEGSGSTFTLSLPAAVVAVPETSARRPLRGRRVLVVEFDAACRERLCAALVLPAVAVDGAGSFAETAACLAGGTHYDVALLGPHLFDDRDRVLGLLDGGRTGRAIPYVRLRQSGDTGDPPSESREVVELLESATAVQLRDALEMATRMGSAAESARVADPRPLDVLLAEDNDNNRLVTAAILSQLGHSVSAVRSGTEVLEAAARRHFDVVLMDLHMPELGGLDAARALRHTMGPKSPPIVPVTADASAEMRRRCADAGMTEFLAKPFSAAALSQALRAAVAGAETHPPVAGNR